MSDERKNPRLFERVRTARGRKASSTRWLQRQLNDPYVKQAAKDGYRSRAAYKLSELQEKFALIPKRGTVIDLGAAPGGWTQVALRYADTVIGIDLLEMEPVENATLIQGDFTEEEGEAAVRAALNGGRAHCILSDMAASSCGHQATDHLRTLALCEIAYAFCEGHLAAGGAFVAKLFQGGAEKELLDALRADFTKVRHVKPAASRKESSELYLVCTGYKGL